MATASELSPHDEARLGWLAVFGGDFDRPAAATVWGLPVVDESAEDTLLALHAAGLVEIGPNPLFAGDGMYGDSELLNSQRYALTAQGRAEAERLSTRADMTLAALRHAEYYENVNRGANYRYIHDDSRDYALALYDQERHNIEAAWAWLQANAGNDEARLAMVNDFVLYGYYILPLRVSQDEYARRLDAAIRAAQALGDDRARMYHLSNLGELLLDLGEVEQAIVVFEQALEIAQATKDREAEGQALDDLGLAHALLGEPARSLSYHEKALEIAEEVGDTLGKAVVLANIGQAHYDLGRRPTAYMHTQEALKLFEAQGAEEEAAELRRQLAEWGMLN